MKTYKELKLDELSVNQKLGLSMIAFCWSEDESDVDYLEKLVRSRSLGGVWVYPRGDINQSIIKRLRDAADYPLLFFTDAENGWGNNRIPSRNAIGMTNSEELAYVSGKITAIAARKDGYNVICSPILDMVNARWLCGGNLRSLGSNKETVVRLAAAEARGMQDAGVLTVGKHFPGASKTGQYIDAHMGEMESDETKEELLSYNLDPYLELMKNGLLDGVMLKHGRFPAVDPDYPASLSSEHIKILRERGFDGFAMSDALNMMGVVAKFGAKMANGLAVGNARAIALPFQANNEKVMRWLAECYDEGIITDEALDRVVGDVLAAQHKVAVRAPKFEEITEEDKKLFDSISTKSVFAKCDDGVPLSLDKDAPHFFAILTETELGIKDGDKVAVDTMRTDWYNPLAIGEKLKSRFPNCKVGYISEYPTPAKISQFLSESLGHGDIVFITFFKSAPYAGRECLTSRILSMMDAMQVSGRISTVVHFGNPYITEDLPHVPRVIIGGASRSGVDAGIRTLWGECEAQGVLTYDVKLK